MTRASEPGACAHPAEREHLEGQPRADAAGDERRHPHRAHAEEQPEPRAERSAAQHDEEEHPRVVAREVEQAPEARRTPTAPRGSRPSRRSSSRVGPRARSWRPRAPPTRAATSGASPAWAEFGSAVPGIQNGYRNAAAPRTVVSTYTAIGRARPPPVRPEPPGIRRRSAAVSTLTARPGRRAPRRRRGLGRPRRR